MADTQRRVPSSYVNSRLKWTRQLHEHFVEAVAWLGGANKATPRSVKKAMGIPELTLYHIKSHLQKYRLAEKRSPEGSFSCRRQDCSAEESRSTAHIDMARNQSHVNENMLQMHTEVERKLHEQIEVQRHLQLRIEAQGRYLQSALRRAQDMLAGYNLGSTAREVKQSELSEPVWAVDTECRRSSSSGGSPASRRRAGCSGDSCLTCWETEEEKGDKLCKQETRLLHHSSGEDSDDVSSGVRKPAENMAGYESGVGNRGCSSLCEEKCALGRPGCSSHGHSLQRENCWRVQDEIDLNREPMLPRSLILRAVPVSDLSHAG